VFKKSMMPTTHLIASLVPFAFLLPTFKYWTFAFFIGSFFIDVDHYIWYVMRFKNLSLKGAYEYSLPRNKKTREMDILHIFHVWEFWVLMLILGFIHVFFFLIFAGMVFHLAMDFIYLHVIKAYGHRAISYFFWLKRHSKD